MTSRYHLNRRLLTVLWCGMRNRNEFLSLELETDRVLVRRQDYIPIGMRGRIVCFYEYARGFEWRVERENPPRCKNPPLGGRSRKLRTMAVIESPGSSAPSHIRAKCFRAQYTRVLISRSRRYLEPVVTSNRDEKEERREEEERKREMARSPATRERDFTCQGVREDAV